MITRALLFFFALGCAGCVHFEAEATAESRLAEIFKDENATASKIDVKIIRPHDWHYEYMRWEVEYERMAPEIESMLARLRKECRSDADFVQRLDTIVKRTGCSRALVWAMGNGSFRDFRHRFGFMDIFGKALNPEYRYSKQIHDARFMYL